MTEENNNTSNS